jgi:MerR family transcriptional regulator, Zn(II)-responsive regulator of zntA
MEQSSGKTLSAGELARQAGVSSDTLRHYERKGVITPPPRGSNGYRRYPEEILARVLLIRRALALGFTLDDLAGVLRVRDRGGVPCGRVRALAAVKLEEVERRLRELILLRDDLRSAIRMWDAKLAQTPAGKRAGLLESLRATGAVNRKRSAVLFSTNHKTKRKQTK